MMATRLEKKAVRIAVNGKAYIRECADSDELKYHIKLIKEDIAANKRGRK